MSDLSSVERLKFETLFGMESGYVLGFSNNAFSMFTVENVGIDIFDSKYEYGSSSKANRLRKFWLEESNEVVGKLLSALLNYWLAKKQIEGDELSSREKTLFDECQKIVSRLNQDSFIQIQDNTSSLSQKGSILINGTDIPEPKRPLKVFLCHAHADRDTVKALYIHLTKDGVDAWLDREKLLPGQDRELEIRKAVRDADAVIVCLSKQFIQVGPQQREARLALDTAMNQPEGEIFIVPVRLEECGVPESLQRYEQVDMFDDGGYETLMKSLKLRDEQIEQAIKRKENAVKRRLPYFETPVGGLNKTQQDKKNFTPIGTERHEDIPASQSTDANGNGNDGVTTGEQLDQNSIDLRKEPKSIMKKLFDIKYFSVLVALIVLLFGNNIYQQITGHSVFAGFSTSTATSTSTFKPSSTSTLTFLSPTITPTGTNTITFTPTNTLTLTSSPIPTKTPTATQRPQALRGIDQGCIDKKYWKVSASTSTIKPTPTGNCYDLIDWGIVANGGQLSIVVPDSLGITRAIYTAFSSYQHVEITFDVDVKQLSKTSAMDNVLVLGVGRSDALLTDGHFLFYRGYSDNKGIYFVEYGNNMRATVRPNIYKEYVLSTPQEIKFVIDGLTLEIYVDNVLFKRSLLEEKDHEGFWIGYRLEHGGFIESYISNMHISK